MKFKKLVMLAEDAFKDNNPYISILYWDEAKSNLQSVSHFDEDGYLHRNNGPALTWYDKAGFKEMDRWVIHGKIHRLDGPAWVYYYPGGLTRMEVYFINDVEYTKEEFNDYTENMNKDELDILSDLGQTFE